jgi:L-fucose isomerase-like protein
MTTFGIIVGNRGFFPDRLCESGRKEILQTLEKLGIGTVILPEGATKYGSVESLADARQCADLFAQNAGKIDTSWSPSRTLAMSAAWPMPFAGSA